MVQAWGRQEPYIRRVQAVIRGRVSALHYDYSGSWDIPIDWLERTGLFPYQKIALMNPSPVDKARERMLYTYILPTSRGSACMNANGGIAHYFTAGGDVIIQGFGAYVTSANNAFSPVFLDARQSIVSHYGEACIPDWLDVVAGKLHLACLTDLIDPLIDAANEETSSTQEIRRQLRGCGLDSLGQLICVLSEDLAEMVGFSSFEAISLYPANGNPRFNRSVMCYVLAGMKGVFGLVGDGVGQIAQKGERMIACRYITLPKELLYQHSARVHILNVDNQSERQIMYRMSEYLDTNLKWK